MNVYYYSHYHQDCKWNKFHLFYQLKGRKKIPLTPAFPSWYNDKFHHHLHLCMRHWPDSKLLSTYQEDLHRIERLRNNCNLIRINPGIHKDFHQHHTHLRLVLYQNSPSLMSKISNPEKSFRIHFHLQEDHLAELLIHNS